MGLATMQSPRILVEREIINHPDFSGTPEDIPSHDEVYIGSCVYDPLGKEIVIKIPLVNQGAKRLCMNEYDLKRTVGDHTHIHQLYLNEPLEIGPYHAVLSKKAKYGSVSHQMREGKLDETNSTLYILHASKGLQVIHKSGKTHKDIKPSNILLYDENWAVLSDFGVVTEKENTRSAKNQYQFWSPEIWVMKNSKTFIYDQQEDIFQIGATYFMMLSAGEGLSKRLETLPFSAIDSPQQIISKYYPIIRDLIEQQPFKYDTKRRLRRMLGPKHPGKIPSGKTHEDYRYQSIEALISDLEGKSGIIEIREYHPDVSRYLSSMKELQDAIAKAKKKKKWKWGTIDYETIDSLVTSENNTLALQNLPAIKADPTLSRKAQPLHDTFTTLQKEDYDALLGVITGLKDNIATFVQYGNTEEERVKKFWIPMYEIAYLWGPPFTETKALTGVKDRYTLTDIRKQETHFHKEEPWR